MKSARSKIGRAIGLSLLTSLPFTSSGCDNNQETKKSQNAYIENNIEYRPVEKQQRILVRVDIKVGVDGKPVETKLSDNNIIKSGLVAQQALSKAQTLNFPTKSDNGKGIEYWKKEVLIEAGQVKALNTPYK